MRYFRKTDTFVPRALAFAGLLFSLSSVKAQDNKPVSFFQEIVPIFKRSCTGCHHPGKLKGQLDLTAYETFQKGGKHGPSFKPGDPKNSTIIEEISGPEPSMPKEGDPLSKSEVALIERWIAEGAKNDSPANANTFKLSEPPVYKVAPVISALAYSPDGSILAISGYHEVLLHKTDGSGIIARLVGESTRIESLAFSTDGKSLLVGGSAPARFGEIQVWDVAKREMLKSFKVAYDSIYGVSFSPDAERIAFGCADNTARVVAAKDGKELLKFENHSDWVLATAFTVDGKRLLTGSRDRAMKMIDASNGQFIDDINKLLENILCMSRHPKLDQAAYGGALGTPRLYKIAENQGRTAANNDVNLVREFERQPGAVHAVAFSVDGSLLAVGGVANEVRIYKTSTGARAATLKGHEGAIFSLAFHPAKNEIVTGGFDGSVRVYDTGSGDLVTKFIPVPIKAGQTVAKAPTEAKPVVR
jgi:WD40 repeat protein